MKRIERIKLEITRNWKLPGKERLARLFTPSGELKQKLKDGIVWLTGEDIAIYVNPDSYIEYTILSTGTYEDEINKVIRLSLKSGGNALDIGGNIGLQSIRMSQCAGAAGKIYAFEPLEYLQEKFRKNVSLNKAGNVTLFPYALADEESEADFTISTNLWNQGAFSLNTNITGGTTQRVKIKIGDNMPELQNLESLDLVKIDVEGFEYPVLRGLAQILKKHMPRIIFEYDSNYWNRNNQNIVACYQMLKSLGYKLYQITSVGCEPISDISAITDGNLFCIPDIG